MVRGTRVGQAYVALAVDGDGVNEDIVDSVDEAGPGVRKAGKDHGEKYSDGFEEGSRSRFGKIVDRISGATRDKMGRAGHDSGADFSKNFESHFGDDFFNRLGANVGGHFIGALTSAIDREAGMEDNPIADLFDKWMAQAVSGNGKGGKGGRKDEGIGGFVGRMFGAGSRNNFLNVFGKSLGGIVGLMEKVAAGGAKVFTSFYKGTQQAAEGASLLQKTMAGFSEVGASIGRGGAGLFASIAESGPAAVVAIFAITAALSVMVSVVGALLGLVTALAATIASALTGAVLIAAGAFSALGAAVGLAVVAFTSMTDAQKKMLSDAFRPLKAELTGIGQIMLQQMVPAFATWSANLQNALMQAVPVAQVMGQAFAQAGNIITASLSGPGFQMFTQALTTYLPGIVTSLSMALGSFLNGLLAVFAALMPYVSQFADYLARVAEEFSVWATSAQGQNAIVDFVDRAVVSIQSLWNFITSFTGFLFDVLFSPEAMSAGNTIFDSLAATFRNFSEEVARASANGDLQRWFDDAIQFGSALWQVIEALGGTFIALYNSGVLQAVGQALLGLATVIDWLNRLVQPMIDKFGGALPHAIGAAISPIGGIIDAMVHMGGVLDWLLGKIGVTIDRGAQAFNNLTRLASTANVFLAAVRGTGNSGAGSANAMPGQRAPIKLPSLSMGTVKNLGTSALNATSTKYGGYKAPPVKSNPYKGYAQSLAKQNAATYTAVKKAVLNLQTAAVKGIRDAAATKGDAADVRGALADMMTDLVAGGKDIVNTAKGGRATRLARQKQAELNEIAKNLGKQRLVKWDNVASLTKGLKTNNVTLAEFAEARSRIATKLEAAQQKLVDAISLRDDYAKQVADSIKTFGALAGAQAQTIDGVEQTLTANDITSNLQDKLTQIQKFQSDLQLLIANGLSTAAYKQIVDQGVTNGSALAEALLGGGSSAIQSTNSLVSQIDGIATTLGQQTSTRMYQAGVDAAKGLVDGLTSLSAQLDAAAAKLGNAIAASIAKALKIKSPSRVMRDLMGYVGDGMAMGLDDQHVKVGSAATALADLIAVNPGGKPAAGGPPVSGNEGSMFRDLVVHTPTDDPKAVAIETVNELVGRL